MERAKKGTSQPASKRWLEYKPTNVDERTGPETGTETVEARMDAISRACEEMDRTPRSAVQMCHEQGKTAVYLSKDKKHIVEEPPHGPITHKRLTTEQDRQR